MQHPVGNRIEVADLQTGLWRNAEEKRQPILKIRDEKSGEMKMNGSVNSETAIARPAGGTDRAHLSKGESVLLLGALFTLAASLASFVTL